MRVQGNYLLGNGPEIRLWENPEPKEFHMSYFYVMPKGDQISLAWGDETKDTVFGGIAWSGHNVDLAACQEADARISELENRLDGERAIRDQLRNQLGERNRKVYYGVLAHPDYGDDCPLLARMGYTRRSDQDSGLTRPALISNPPTGSLN